MDELTVRLILLMVPGIISTLIFKRLTFFKNWSSFMFALNAILFGVASYLILYLFSLIPCFKSDGDEGLKVWSNLNYNMLIPYSEVLWASLISIFLGFFSANIENKKWLTRIAFRIGITTKFGEESLFMYFLSRNDVQDVYIRDIGNNLTYHGVLVSYAEVAESKEVVLRDAHIYRYVDSVLLYEVDQLYLSISKEFVIIESNIVKK